MSTTIRQIYLVEVNKLRHIERFSQKRVQWLKEKIIREGVWTVPIKIDDQHNLVMDGQHRMEVAKSLGFKVVPCLKYSYQEVEVWSLRNNHEVTSELIIKKALSENIYPYKTAKHGFPDSEDARCEYEIIELKK